MPYRWTVEGSNTASLRIWPHRSLSPRGFATFIGVTAAMFLVPLMSVLGTPILWVLLAYIALVLALAWYLIQRNTSEGALTETLTLSSRKIDLVRQRPHKAAQHWHANPHWVRVELDDTGGPVENYVTLHGAGREVEIGAFLSPDERVALFHDLQDRLRRLDINAH